MKYALLLLMPSLLLAEPIFTDDFESGDLSKSEGGVSYQAINNTSVSSVESKDGNYSLQFFFRGGGANEDAFAEQRMTLPVLNEIWVEYDIYIPDNYDHRTGGASNNKFIAIYRNPYEAPGFQVNFSTVARGDGGSAINVHRFRNGIEQRILTPLEGVTFIEATDVGKWIHIKLYVKPPTDDLSWDGVMKMWKDGEIVTEYTRLNNYAGSNKTYMDELYLLGWSNSGYDSDTYFYIDNLVISDSEETTPPPIDPPIEPPKTCTCTCTVN